MDFFNWMGLILLISGISFWAVRRSKATHSSQDYFVSDKSTSLFALVATLVMTELNTSTLVGFAGMGYTYGTSAVSLSLIFLIGLLFYAVSVAKKWKEFDGVSVTTFFEKRYNRTIGYVAAGVLGVAMLGFSANFLKSLTLIFSPLFPTLSLWTLSALFCGMMVLISIRGGLRSIIQLDKVSFVITLLLFGALFSKNSLELFTLSSEISDPYPELSPPLLLSLIVVTMFTYILAPWYGQKIFSARSSRVAYQAVIISAFVVAGLYGCIILTAASVSADPGGAQMILPQIIAKLPFFLQGIAYGVLFFIAATTIVGLWNTLASVLLAHHPQNLEEKSLKTSRVVTLSIALTSYLLANLFVDNVFEKLILANIPISALAFSLLGGFYWARVSALASLCSILTGVGGGVVCYLYWGDPGYLWVWAFYVIPLHFVVGIGATYIFSRSTDREKRRELPVSA